MLSVDAVQLTVIEVVVDAVFVRPVGAVGAVVSGQSFVVAVIDARGDRLFAASYASTASVYDVPQTRPVNTHERPVVVATEVPLR
jgi:hypothetical protein